jgi:hypothetical protein
MVDNLKVDYTTLENLIDFKVGKKGEIKWHLRK